MRNMKAFLPLTFLILLSCDGFFKCDKGEYDFKHSNAFGFHILDKTTKKNLLYIGETNYDYDTIKILDSDFRKVYPLEGRWTAYDGLSIIEFIDKYKDKNVIDQRLKRTYYFYFNHTDLDTIEIEFEMKKDECDKQIIKYFKVAYNDSVYFDGATDYVYSTDLLK
jgi:hypothetical protein